MNTKLTLNIDQNVIEEQNFMKKQYISLSKLIENYLLSLTKKNSEKTKVSPLVESLTGVISLESKDYKKNILITYLKNILNGQNVSRYKYRFRSTFETRGIL